MADNEILTLGRRLHNALRHAIEDGDGLSGEPQWENEERPKFEHYSCGMYLVSSLAFLAGQFGEKCWNVRGSDFDSLEAFTTACPRSRYRDLNITSCRLDALHEIRNSIVHNSGNVRRNNSQNSEQMIVAADIQGVLLDSNNGEIRLISNNDLDFMEWVRVSYLCVTEYYGLWGGPSKWT